MRDASRRGDGDESFHVHIVLVVLVVLVLLLTFTIELLDGVEAPSRIPRVETNARADDPPG